MTNDEVIAFKQYHYMKGSNETEQQKTVFHSAFKDPRQTSWFPELRMSTEYRLGVMHK